jgi:hypothetical protein
MKILLDWTTAAAYPNTTCTLVNMSTLVQHSFNESKLLTIANVKVVVRTEARPTVLGENNYQEHGWRSPFDRSRHCLENFESIKRHLERRDWRNLREALVNLNLDDAPSVCKWLGSAGYVPQTMLTEPNAVFFTGQDVQRMSCENLGWQPDLVTPGIRQWLKRYRDVFAWLMTLSDQQFQQAIREAREFFANQSETSRTEIEGILYQGKKPKLKEPRAMFLKETGERPDLDADTLGLALRGTAISEAALAHFYWDDDGTPLVVAHADAPIAAICLSIHIDRNFSSRRWVQCVRCGNWLDQIRGRDRFCSKKCRNYVTTTERRKKIEMLAEAEQAWRATPARKRKGRDHWQWIAVWAERKSKGKCDVEPSWAKQELTKMRTQKRTKDTKKNSRGR